MRTPYTQLYVHLVWATWDRLPLLTSDVRRTAYASFNAECESHGAELLAAGGIEDHVHLLVRLPTTISIAALVKQLKGVSSYRLTRRGGETFRWQGGYGAFTVSKSAVPRVVEYIRNQERHHREGTFLSTLEPTMVGHQPDRFRSTPDGSSPQSPGSTPRPRD